MIRQQSGGSDSLSKSNRSKGRNGSSRGSSQRGKERPPRTHQVQGRQWKTAVDPSTGQTYYYDPVSRQTQWEKVRWCGCLLRGMKFLCIGRCRFEVERVSLLQKSWNVSNLLSLYDSPMKYVRWRNSSARKGANEIECSLQKWRRICWHISPRDV